MAELEVNSCSKIHFVRYVGRFCCKNITNSFVFPFYILVCLVSLLYYSFVYIFLKLNRDVNVDK